MVLRFAKYLDDAANRIATDATHFFGASGGVGAGGVGICCLGTGVIPGGFTPASTFSGRTGVIEVGLRPSLALAITSSNLNVTSWMIEQAARAYFLRVGREPAWVFASSA